MTYPVIWLLTDNRPGNNNQVLGVADGLELPYVIKEIHYSSFVRLPNILRGASLLGVHAHSKSMLAPPYPDLLLSAGRKLAPVALYIKKQSQGTTKLVHFMRPNAHEKSFDLIVLPEHDGVKQRNNLMVIAGAPHRVTQAKLHDAKEKWLPTFEHLLPPRIALLVGGDTKKNPFTLDHAKELADKANSYRKQHGGSFMVTTSRRTSSEAANTLEKMLEGTIYFHRFGQGGENPYMGMLSVADSIITTGDSISMCSESCSTGKPVFIYAPEDLTPTKHQRFHQTLYRANNAKPLGQHGTFKNYTPLNDTLNIANRIKELF